MTADAYINAHCRIEGGVVNLNGQPVFGSPGAAPDTLFDEAYRHFSIGYPKFYKMDRLAKLGMLTAHVLLSGRTGVLKPDRTAVVLANANSSLDTDARYFETVAGMASPALFVYTLPNILIGEICIRYKLRGENAFFVFKDFDANFIAGYAGELLATDLADNVLVGWVDILGDRYRSWMALVEKTPGPNSVPFTPENCQLLYDAEHG